MSVCCNISFECIKHASRHLKNLHLETPISNPYSFWLHEKKTVLEIIFVELTFSNALFLVFEKLTLSTYKVPFFSS